MLNPYIKLRANTVPKWEDKLEIANIVHLQESEHRPQRQVMVGFKTKSDWGFIMAEAGIEGASLSASHFDRSKVLVLQKVFFVPIFTV